MPFRIRRYDTFLERYVYSTGGSSPDWRTDPDRGKLWRTIGQVKNHLNAYNEYNGGYPNPANKIPKDWEVVEVEVKMVERVFGTNAHEMAQTKVDKDRIRQLRWKRDAEEREKAELARLQAKYPKEK